MMHIPHLDDLGEKCWSADAAGARESRRTDVGPGYYAGCELLGPGSSTSVDGDGTGATRCGFVRRRGRGRPRCESAWDLIELNERRRRPVN